jgi:hypothetical protein
MTSPLARLNFLFVGVPPGLALRARAGVIYDVGSPNLGPRRGLHLKGDSRDPRAAGLRCGDAPNVWSRFAPPTRYFLATGSPPVWSGGRLRGHNGVGAMYRDPTGRGQI